jgi:hypothetical protein
MPQRSFGRSVARAAASGGSRAYRGRPPVAWYLALLAIVVVGIGLIVYSRQEIVHPPAAGKTEAPTETDTWHAAVAFTICGKTQPALPVNSNLASTGLRTFGDGLVYIEPGAVGSSKASAFEGAKANLATFVSNYPGLTLTATSLKLPSSKLYRNGDLCSTVAKGAPAAVRSAATGSVVITRWSSPTAKPVVLHAADPSTIRLTNGEMLSIGFVTPSETLPVPSSRTALLPLLGSSGGKSSKT